jgi:hypothetical protein
MTMYPMSFRLDQETIELIKATAEQFGVSQRDVIRMAVRAFAKKQDVAVKKGGKRAAK